MAARKTRTAKPAAKRRKSAPPKKTGHSDDAIMYIAVIAVFAVAVVLFTLF